MVRSTQYLKASLFCDPPMICIISRVSLKLADSNFMLCAGEMSKMNPKSMWMRFPFSLINMFPLCLSLILLTQYSYNEHLLVLPTQSLLMVLGMTSMIPPTLRVLPVLLEMALQGNTQRSNPILSKIPLNIWITYKARLSYLISSNTLNIQDLSSRVGLELPTLSSFVFYSSMCIILLYVIC